MTTQFCCMIFRVDLELYIFQILGYEAFLTTYQLSGDFYALCYNFVTKINLSILKLSECVPIT